MRRFTQRGIVLFSGCFLAGVVITLGSIFGAAYVEMRVRGGVPLRSGEFGDYIVLVNEEGDKVFEQSIDIILDDQLAARFGKRRWPDKPDFAMIDLEESGVTALMLLDEREDASPGIHLFKDNVFVTKIRLGEEDVHEPKAYYGLYNEPDEVKAGDEGYVDVDFDGRFDVRDIFDADDIVAETFIHYRGDWEQTISYDDKANEATVFSDGRRKSICFVPAKGWCEKATVPQMHNLTGEDAP